MVHTTGGSEKPTEESARERDLGVEVGRDSRYGSIYVCPPSPPRDPAPRCSPLSSIYLMVRITVTVQNLANFRNLLIKLSKPLTFENILPKIFLQTY